MSRDVATAQQVTLVDLLDRLLDCGVVVAGDLVLALAGIDLVHVDLRVLLSGVEASRERGRWSAPISRDRHAPPRPVPPMPSLPQRLDGDESSPDRGLARLVLALVELIRQLMESQAIARVEGGGLTDAEEERLGRALFALDQRLAALRDFFGVTENELRMPVGTAADLARPSERSPRP